MDVAKEFVEFATLDQENLKNWATGVYTNEYLKAIDPDFPDEQAQAAGDFVSSQVVVEKIIDRFDDSELSTFLGGQNSYAGFAAAAPSIAKLMQGSDDAIQRALCRSDEPIPERRDFRRGYVGSLERCCSDPIPGSDHQLGVEFVL